jgi:nucleoside-diphosphate-sugar epimerase
MKPLVEVLLPTRNRAALSGGDFPMTAVEQVRDFVPVEAVAAEFVATAAQAPLAPGVPWVRNVGTGRPQTLRAFAEHWWTQWNASGKLLPGALPYRQYEVMRYVPEVHGSFERP